MENNSKEVIEKCLKNATDNIEKEHAISVLTSNVIHDSEKEIFQEEFMQTEDIKLEVASRKIASETCKAAVIEVYEDLIQESSQNIVENVSTDAEKEIFSEFVAYQENPDQYAKDRAIDSNAIHLANKTSVEAVDEIFEEDLTEATIEVSNEVVDQAEKEIFTEMEEIVQKEDELVNHSELVAQTAMTEAKAEIMIEDTDAINVASGLVKELIERVVQEMTGEDVKENEKGLGVSEVETTEDSVKEGMTEDKKEDPGTSEIKATKKINLEWNVDENVEITEQRQHVIGLRQHGGGKLVEKANDLEDIKDENLEDDRNDKDKDDNQPAAVVKAEANFKEDQEEDEDAMNIDYDQEQQKNQLSIMPAMLTDTMTSDFGGDEMILNNTLDNCQVDVMVKNNRVMTPTPKESPLAEESPLSGGSPSNEDSPTSKEAPSEELLAAGAPVSEDSLPRDSTISREAPARESTIVVKAKRDLKDLEQQLIEKEKERVTTFMLEETRIRKEREKLILQQEELKNERLKLELEGERARIVRLQEKQKEEEKRHKQDLEDSRLNREKEQDAPKQQEIENLDLETVGVGTTEKVTDDSMNDPVATTAVELSLTEDEKINTQPTTTEEIGDQIVTSTPGDNQQQPKKVRKK